MGRRIALVLVVVLVTGCSQTVASPSVPASASPSEPAEATASPQPTAALLPSTTEPVDEAPEGALVIQLGPGPTFTPERVQANASDELVFFLDATEINEGSAHNFKIGPELPPGTPLAESDIIERGVSVAFTVTGLEPGSYVFWCSVQEHHTFGMHGTLVVEG